MKLCITIQIYSFYDTEVIEFYFVYNKKVTILGLLLHKYFLVAMVTADSCHGHKKIWHGSTSGYFLQKSIILFSFKVIN